MPKTLGDFLSQLITKGGGNPADDKFKIFFGNTELIKSEVPDDVAQAIDNGLISIKDAKNNHTDIKNHYTKQALDGIDKSLEDLMGGVPDPSLHYRLVPKHMHERGCGDGQGGRLA